MDDPFRRPLPGCLYMHNGHHKAEHRGFAAESTPVTQSAMKRAIAAGNRVIPRVLAGIGELGRQAGDGLFARLVGSIANSGRFPLLGVSPSLPGE